MILGKKLLALVESVHRNFSTKVSYKSKKWPQDGYRTKDKPKKGGIENTKTKVQWTDEQIQIISAISEGKSVFITGSAGTGKTILVQHVIKLLKKQHGASKVYVTAPTGVAACAIGGQTLHSFASIGYPMADRETLLHRIVLNNKAYKRWLKVKALVIDEISMVDTEFFESLEYIARNIREVDTSWGGIQIVVSGDFFQLPPIKPHKNLGGKEFAFEADCWNSSFDLQVNLTKVFRQSDPQLIKLLNGIRRGESNPEDLKFLEQCCSEGEPDTSVVKLYPRIEDVNRVNASRLKSLGNKLVVYTAVDSGEESRKPQLEQGIAPKEVILCKNARVMLVKNLNTWRGLVNGATGTVQGFYAPANKDLTGICHAALPIVKFDSGPELLIEPETWVVTEGDKVVAKRKQVPLILAWASSIHKCQGMTLDRLHTDLSKAFENGMVYVALSRVRSLKGLYLSGFDCWKIMVHPKVLQFYRSFCGELSQEGNDDHNSQQQDSMSRTGNDIQSQNSTSRSGNGSHEDDGSKYVLVHLE
ncbi:ATP-dependent DNA helicase PIF1-like [Argentina anserina]|uniref:ATP-dependent DNA helicase PIF1-like n=1 Tax=Argentina anserina TaxID=57926 RepID=UPI0021767C5E|nr:ATP-dependent DNA helicase PIF1-like [Potentilla anserina]